uniref:Uncharacterized protein n=1 Tax=Arundo donax TaxID=35708 RepID=A0A0A8Y4Z2_ARUDO
MQQVVSNVLLIWSQIDHGAKLCCFRLLSKGLLLFGWASELCDR